MSKPLQTLLASNRARAKKSPGIQASGNEATIYIYDSIVSDDDTAEWWGGVSAASLVPEIRALKVDTIHLRINSPGGDVFAAQAICQAIRDSAAHVIAHVDGFAASAATIIATAADEIRISEGGMYMIHCGWTWAMGNANEMRATAGLLDKVDQTICAQYAKKTGKPEAEIKQLMEAETWFTAQDAVDGGFIDSIAEGKKVKSEWDLSAYKNAPKPDPETIDNSASDEHRDRQRQRLNMLSRLKVS